MKINEIIGNTTATPNPLLVPLTNEEIDDIIYAVSDESTTEITFYIQHPAGTYEFKAKPGDLFGDLIGNTPVSDNPNDFKIEFGEGWIKFGTLQVVHPTYGYIDTSSTVLDGATYECV